MRLDYIIFLVCRQWLCSSFCCSLIPRLSKWGRGYVLLLLGLSVPQIHHCWFTYQYQPYLVAVSLSLFCLLWWRHIMTIVMMRNPMFAWCMHAVKNQQWQSHNNIYTTPSLSHQYHDHHRYNETPDESCVIPQPTPGEWKRSISGA